MKRILSLAAAILAAMALLPAQTKVMSHRGYYAHPGSFENTLTSLKGAQELGVEGVELDVHPCDFAWAEDSRIQLSGCAEIGFQDRALLRSS